MTQPFPLIDLSGAPAERGYTYGAAARDRIRKGVAHYGAQISNAVERVGLPALASRFVQVIESFDSDYLIEMRGIANGAGVNFEDVLLLNARTEIVKLAERMTDLSQDDPPDGCTTVAVLPEVSREGRLVHAQNWDWKAACAETCVVLRIRRDDGPDVLTFTEAGALGRSGTNSAGLGLTGNYLQSDRDYRGEGVPLALIRRKALECAHLAEAIRVVRETPTAASSNMTLSHADGVVLNFEKAPEEAFHTHPEGGLFVHANHWTSPAALARLVDTGLREAPDSLYRDSRVHAALFPKRPDISEDDVVAALADNWQSPFSVCRPPRPGMGGAITATVAMIVIDPAKAAMRIAPMPAAGISLTEYALSSETKRRVGTTTL